jgi:hypothetical protein
MDARSALTVTDTPSPYLKPRRQLSRIDGFAGDSPTRCHGISLKQTYEVENLPGGISLVASTGGVTLLPLYVQHVLIPAVVARP